MNKRYKRQYDLFIYRNQPVRVTLGSVCVMGLCLLLMIASTFTQLKLAYVWFSPEGQMIFKTFMYIPQIPVVLFSASLLGAPLSAFAVALYIIIGLFVWPVFALGGGWHYIFNFNFGYILGFFPAVILCAKILQKNPSVFGVLKADLIGVLTIHLVGMLYVILAGLFAHSDVDAVTSWIYHLSVSRIAYDFVVCGVVLYLSRYLKGLLWQAMD